ncbi:MAG: acetyl-CoA carboxylase biotin carboxyl carrier protein [Verrucomicrobiota bacterium]|nr:acetyl-CoA carboxylase biotin carboxyl carrier protein [Verrucomicrobiota bacterium]
MTCLAKPLYLKRSTSNQGRELELKDIKAVIDLMKKNDLSVFEMEKDGFKLKLQKGAGEQTVFPQAAAVSPTAPAASSAPATASAPAAAAAEKPAPLKEIVSPMVGTFYRAASPEAPSFADVGKTVNEESVVCIIEAMKVMNEIKAEVSGVIAEVVAENGKPVQFGQVLFRVR